MHKLLVVTAFLWLAACAESESRPQFQPCDEPFNGSSCPDDCWEVRQNSSDFPDCEASELLLGCASGPQTLPEYNGPGNAEAAQGAFSVENGLQYRITRDFYRWLRANEERFCTATNDPKCPEPDPAILAACSE